MSDVEKYLIWFGSFLLFLLILFISYKISYKLGIKKALYRTTYILLSVIFAFVLTPLFNDYFFKLDLSNFDIKLVYKDESFYTLVDYIEEVIVHSDFLNDIYKYFPSLKDLFMDFPEVILAPITYVLLFFIFIIVWLPLYLYLSYKRKRRILYDRPDNRNYRVWAGILGIIQCVFIFSVVLTPLNGFNRIYHRSMEKTLDDEYHSLCGEIESLEKYSKICDLIDVYDSTVFASIGGKGSLNDYVFDALTRISYEDGYTNIATESSLIMKTSIVLDQSGLFESLSKDSEVIPVDLLINNKLSDEDIDIIMDTISNSKYSKDLLIEVGDLIVNTLDNLISEFLGYKEFVLDYSMTTEEIISEIKIAFKAIKVLSERGLLPQILEVKEVIENFVNYTPKYNLDDRDVFAFILEMLNSIDLEDFELFCDYLFESQIFSKTIPYVIDKFFGFAGFNFIAGRGDVLDQFYNFIDLSKLMKKYQPIDFFEIMTKLNDEELLMVSEIFQHVSTSKETRPFVDFIFSKAFANFDVYSMEDIYAIDNWNDEIYIIKDFCSIIYEGRASGEIDVYSVIKLLKQYKDSNFAKILINIVQRNLDFFIRLLLSEEENFI